MVTYIAQRLIAIVLILVVMSLLIFAITQVMPGNVAHMIAGQFATPDVVAAIEAKLGLQRSDLSCSTGAGRPACCTGTSANR